MSPWYKVTFEQLQDLGAGGLLGGKFYNESIYKMVKTVYPEHEWLPWKFESMPKKYWADPDVVLSVLRYLKRAFGLTSRGDWEKITRAQLKELGVLHVITQNGGLSVVLEKFLPALESKAEAHPSNPSVEK